MPSSPSYLLMSLAAVFSPTPGTPGRLSDGSPRERGVLDVAGGVHAGALLDARLVVERVVGHAPPVVEDLDGRVLDQLVAVAVAGDDDHVATVVAGPGGQRGDDVVGLDPGLLEGGDLEGVDDLADQTHLLAQDVGRRAAVGLVGLDPLVAERRLRPVEGHRQPVVGVVAQQVDEHRREPEHRVGDLPGGGGHVGRQGEERAVGQRVPVDEHEGGRGVAHRHPRYRQP